MIDAKTRRLRDTILEYRPLLFTCHRFESTYSATLLHIPPETNSSPISSFAETGSEILDSLLSDGRTDTCWKVLTAEERKTVLRSLLHSGNVTNLRRVGVSLSFVFRATSFLVYVFYLS